MDPIAHTLIGASLAETPLGRRTAMAAPTLIFGANAPDLDAATIFLGSNLSLGFRRGWTHGVLAMAVLPIALTGLILLLDRIVARVRGREARARAGPVLALAYLGVLTHPALDWLNTYGVRFLMPFDGTWFYGDALFIIDPWVWLLAGTAVVLAHTRSRSSIGLWLALGVVVTSLVTGFPGTPTTSRLLWCAGTAAIVGLRLWGVWQRQLPRVAIICLVSISVYAVTMAGLSILAEQHVRAWLAERDDHPVAVMASPVPANPFRHDIVVDDGEHYHFLELNWLATEQVRIAAPAVDRGPSGPVVDAALTAPHVQGVRTWMRFPAFVVEETATGYRVSISDLRYARRPGGGLGSAVVELDHDLNVR